MSQYTKSTNFATKDNLTPGDPLKVVRGTEIDTEYNNIATAIATKTDNASAAITGGTITGITDLAVADGGTGASTAAGALNNLLPSQISNANKYLQSDGTNASWDAVTLSTADITGTLGVANGGTGVTASTGTGSVVLSNSPTLVTPALGTPSGLVGTNISGTAPSLTAGNVTTNANLTGDVTSVGNATTLTNAPVIAKVLTGYISGAGTVAATDSILQAIQKLNGNDATNANLTGMVTSVGNATTVVTNANLTGGVTSVGNATTVVTNANLTGAVTSSGNATSLGSFSSANLLAALTDETGTGANVFATSPTLVTPNLGTPTTLVLTSATGLPLTTGVTGTLPTANGGTNLTSFTSGGVVYASSSSALATGSALTFDGTSAFALKSNNASNFAYFDVGRTTAEARIATASATNDFLTGTAAGDALFYKVTVGNAWYGTASTGAAIFTINNGEQMRLTSSSLYTASGINVGIGLSNPASYGKLVVSGGGFTQLATIALPATSGSTRSDFTRILDSAGSRVLDSSISNTGAWIQSRDKNDYSVNYDLFLQPNGGNLLVGTTSASGKINCVSSADQHTIRAENTNATLASNIIYANATRNTTNGSFNAFAYYNTTAGSYKFYVIDSGAIYSTSIVITSISDQRLKENVRDIDTGLNSIMELKPRRFDWKEGKGQDKKDVAGFIAQEFEDVFPECVSTSKAGEDGIEYKNINHETLIPTLVKAIQEQQAMIESLRQRLSAANL